jgi:hypothetical protein
MLTLAGALLIVFQLASPTPSQNQVADAVTRAQALYYEAKFKDSVDLLLPIDDALRLRMDRLPEKVHVKLQLALGYIGLNDGGKAKTLLRDLYALDADYSLDSDQYSPKVISLAREAKAEQLEFRCQVSREDARKKLDAGDANGVMDIIGPMKTSCTGLSVMETELAEVFYKNGFDSYKRGDLSAALKNFQATLRLSPKHELATQYIELAQSRQQLAADRLFVQWQKNFESREYALAAKDYHDMNSFSESNAEANAMMVSHAKDEYRKALSAMVDSWNKACMMGDTATMNTVRTQMAEFLPDPTFGEDIRSNMSTCTKTGCLQMNASLAMARLKTRVNPELTPALQNFVRGTQVTVRVKARIDEEGNVTVSETIGNNPPMNLAVRTAVERWKFSSIIDQNGSRCVDTELAIVIGSAQGSTR